MPDSSLLSPCGSLACSERGKPLGMNPKGIKSLEAIREPQIAMIESGVLKNPTMDVLKRLAKSLDVKVADLLG